MEEHRVTALLRRMSAGDREAAGELLRFVYDELHEIARRRLRGNPGSTLQTTALLHEAWLKIAAREGTAWQDRTHFLAVAASAMRQIVIDHARKKRAEKRPGRAVELPLDALQVDLEERSLDLVRLDDLLERLGRVDTELTRIVELRFFAGLKQEEVAEALGVSSRTVDRRWKVARGWLRREMERMQAAERPEDGHGDG